jgi:hypothetical protein
MNQFNKQLFKKKHRTIANICILNTHTKSVEIDITKAYTTAFRKIKEIPVFNEFDTFKLYNRQDIEDNNLYIVKVYRKIRRKK